MSVFVRRAFALLLLGGAVGASLALPAIFDGSQLANRGPLPTGTTPATTHVRVSFPALVNPHRTFNVPSRPAVTTRPAARLVAPVVPPRAHPAPAPPVAAATPVSPPATPAPNPAPAPTTTTAAPDLATVSSDHVIASAPVPTVPAVADTANPVTREKHGNKSHGRGGDHGDGGHGKGNNGNGHSDNGNGHSGNGNGKGH
jgi:hypothetical protein